MSFNLSRLNPHQRQAVLHGTGPLLILAGAGSGKTSTMAHRIAHLLGEKRVPESAILGLSFTNKAAKELKDRVLLLLGQKKLRGLTITTFHSLGVRLLRAHASALGFQSNFTILDQHDQLEILKQVLRNIHIDERRFDPNTLLFEISQAKNRMLGPTAIEEHLLESGRMSSDYAIAASQCYPKYLEQLKMLNAMDFDDLLVRSVELLEQHESIRELYNHRFQHILVDEYQDTNATQFRMLRALTQRQQNLCVVGDDDQSIYGWRGADPSHILKFKGDYPAAQSIILEQNYRSTSRILEAANSVIAHNRNRYNKKLWSDKGEGEALVQVILEDDRAEAEFVAGEILRRSKQHNRPWKDFAILYRSNSQSRVFEEALRRNQVPYKMVGGLSFLDRKEVKSVLAYWKLIVNMKDDASLRRILNWPARGIGRTSIEALGSWAFKNEKPLFDALGESVHNPEIQLSPKSAQAVHRFRDLIVSLANQLRGLSMTPEAVAHWARSSLDAIGAKKAIEEDSDDPAQFARRWENVEELVHSVGQYQISPEGPEATGTAFDFFREFIARITLDSQEIEREQDRKDANDKEVDQITLLTLHGAKGLEYPVVFLVGVEEGFLPHKRSIEGADDLSEERRLCYVGITRAKDHLYLSRAKARIRYGKPVPRIPSRFIADIPSGLMVLMDESGASAPSAEALQDQHEVRVKNYLAEIRARIGKPKSV